MRTRRGQTGFTLIEILIVAAMISLLAGIAAINVQQAYLNNQRKATFGEAKNLSTALSFAFQDIGVYPKLCFLSQNIFFLAPPTVPPYTQPGAYLLSGFESMGYEINQPATLTNRIIKGWAVGLDSQGYMGRGSGRRGMGQGRRGGMVKMEIPTASYNPVVTPPGQPAIYDWPADPWGRPYVVYMLYQHGVQPNGLPDVRFVDSATQTPNYALAIVSYGPNGIPGGPDDYDTAYVTAGQQLWLFTRAAPGSGADYRALDPYAGDYNQERLYAWSHEKLLGEVPPNLSYIGVTDTDSDDIIIDVP